MRVSMKVIYEVGGGARDHPRRRLCGRSGVSLVEAIVAIALFALCIGGICAVVMNARQLGDMARDRYVAANLAKGRLERARSFDFDQLQLFKESAVVLNASGNIDPNGDYRRTTTISNVMARLAEISIRVDIRDRISRQFDDRPETLHSYVADYIKPPKAN
jgi:hypothetical protein